MLNAQRALIIVLLGLFVGSWAFAESQPPPPGPRKLIENPQTQTRDEHQKAKDDKRGTDASPLVIKMVNTPESKIKAEQAAKYQNDETTSSRRLVWITGILAIIAASQACVLIWQASELKKSVKAAKDAANAAQKSADALPLIERAYVFVSIPYHYVAPDKQAPAFIQGEVTVSLFNHGKTPAILNQVKVIIEPRTNCPSDLIGDIKSEIPPGVVISSGGKYDINYPFTFSAEQWGEIENVNLTLFCYGRIKYKDVLDNIRETGFCWDYHPIIHKCFYISDNKKLNYYT